MRLNSPYDGIAQRHRRRLPATSRSGRLTGHWRSPCRTSPCSPVDCSGYFSESRQHAFGDLQLIELVCQLCPFGIKPGELFGNSLPFPSNLVRCRHMYFPSVSRPIMTRQRDHSAIIRGLTHAETYVGEGSERDAEITVGPPSSAHRPLRQLRSHRLVRYAKRNKVRSRSPAMTLLSR
jgi:hypothetical protein